MKYNDIIKLLACIIFCELAGAIGSIFTAPQIGQWYSTLNKPSFNPPNWIFGPVWTTIFVLMGISLYLVWKKNFAMHNKIECQCPCSKISVCKIIFTEPIKKGYVVSVFMAQLVLNILWSVLFFGMQSPGLALLDLVILWLMILVNIAFFYRISKISALLLLPYILWVTFAGVLNYFLWMLN